MLPLKLGWGKLKGDHDENALLMTVNVDYPTETPRDILFALKKEFGIE